MKIRLRGREKTTPTDITPDAGPTSTKESGALEQGISHRQFLKMCGLGALGAGTALAGDMILHPSPASAYTYNEDLFVLGKLGVGTSTPTSRVTVNNTADVTYVDLLDATLIGFATGAFITAKGNSAANSRTAGLNLRIDATNLWQLLTDNAASNGFFVQYNGSSASRFLTVSTSGNVGIGATSPSARLHIGGTNQELRLDWNGTDAHHGSLRWAGLQLGNNGENRIVAGRTATGGALAFYVNNTVEAADYSVTPNGTLAMYISSSANVGIGVPSPQRKLHVGGGVLVEGNVTINPYYDLQVVTGNYHGALQGKYGEVGPSEALYLTSNWDWHAGVRPWATQTTGTAAIRIRTRGEQTISLMTNDNDLAPQPRLTVVGNGRVGIGTTDPHVDSKLDVAGAIFISGAPAIDSTGVAKQCYYAQ